MKKLIPNLTNTTPENNTQISRIYYFHFVKTFFYLLKKKYPKLFIWEDLTIESRIVVFDNIPLIFDHYNKQIFNYFFFKLYTILVENVGLETERAYHVSFRLTRYYFYFNQEDIEKNQFDYSWFCKPTELNQMLRCLDITNQQFEEFVDISIEFEKTYDKKVDNILSKRKKEY